MTPSRLQELKKLCREASETGILKHWEMVEWDLLGYSDDSGLTIQDHDWLEAARTALPELLAEVLVLQEMLDVALNYALHIKNEKRSDQYRQDLFDEMMKRVKSLGDQK